MGATRAPFIHYVNFWKLKSSKRVLSDSCMCGDLAGMGY